MNKIFGKAPASGWKWTNAFWAVLEAMAHAPGRTGDALCCGALAPEGGAMSVMLIEGGGSNKAALAAMAEAQDAPPFRVVLGWDEEGQAHAIIRDDDGVSMAGEMWELCAAMPADVRAGVAGAVAKGLLGFAGGMVAFAAEEERAMPPSLRFTEDPAKVGAVGQVKLDKPVFIDTIN